MKITTDYAKKHIWPSAKHPWYLYRGGLMEDIIEGHVNIGMTADLEREFDKMRAARGFKPFFADLPEDQLDPNGWYEAMLIIEDKVATKIIAYAMNSNDDDTEPYEIPLEREIGIAIYNKMLREAGDVREN